MIWASLGVLMLRSLSCLRSGSGKIFNLRRQCLWTAVQVDLLLLVALLFLKECRSELVVNLLVAFSAACFMFLVVLLGFSLAGWALTSVGFGI